MSHCHVGWKKSTLSKWHICWRKTYKKRERKALHTSHRRTDLLVTKNQSVLHNILDWPTKPNSKLILLGIANIMNLPAELLPQISNRKCIQRLCFGPYNHTQLQKNHFHKVQSNWCFRESSYWVCFEKSSCHLTDGIFHDLLASNEISVKYSITCSIGKYNV